MVSSSSWADVLPEGCKAFGAGASSFDLDFVLAPWRNRLLDLSFLLVLAGSKTAEVRGISAAGATSAARRYTAVADAELLLHGPSRKRTWPLPPLPAGISPALISYVASNWLGLDPCVIAVGLSQTPSFDYLSLEDLPCGPANCLSTGKAMTESRVEALWHQGLSIGRKLRNPLLLAESVPGGTTTAQAVLTGLGLSVAGLISGSALNPPMQLKADLVNRGLNVANLGSNPSPVKLLSAVGDPFQPVAVGLLLGAREAGQPVLLGGGSQMVAVLALALKSMKSDLRAKFASGVLLGTTAWLVEEGIDLVAGNRSPLEQLLDAVGDHFGVKLLGLATGLRFHRSIHKGLRDYESGYVKEGVGAGALALLAQLNGASCSRLVEACDQAMNDLVLESSMNNKSIPGTGE